MKVRLLSVLPSNSVVQAVTQLAKPHGSSKVFLFPFTHCHIVTPSFLLEFLSSLFILFLILEVCLFMLWLLSSFRDFSSTKYSRDQQHGLGTYEKSCLCLSELHPSTTESESAFHTIPHDLHMWLKSSPLVPSSFYQLRANLGRWQWRPLESVTNPPNVLCNLTINEKIKTAQTTSRVTMIHCKIKPKVTMMT